jgi:hypothetical protein
MPSGAPKIEPPRTTGRFVIFDKSNRKEQGLFLYRDAESGLHVQLPLVSSGTDCTADNLSFPHCPGVFDWPNNLYLPVMVPELTFGENVTLPSFYGQKCVTGLGLKNSFYFRYEQPELINTKDEFAYTVKNQVQLDKFRMALVIGAPHSKYRLGTSPALGAQGHRCSVLKDDFHANWGETEVVTADPAYKTNFGKLHYVQMFERDHPLIMRPGQVYRLSVSFDPDLTMVEA